MSATGVLLAYMFFGRGSANSLRGGVVHWTSWVSIDEIYFPYVLMNPRSDGRLAGNTGVFTLTILAVVWFLQHGGVYPCGTGDDAKRCLLR